MAGKKKARKNADTEGQKTRARARTAVQLARQQKCFELSVLGGKTVREIAIELKIDKDTAARDIYAEQVRRRDENAQRVDFESARAIGFYERMIARSMKRADMADTLMASLLDSPQCDESGEKRKGVQWVSDRSLETAMKARERIDKLLGLDAPTKVEVDSVKMMTDEELGSERKSLRAKQAALARIKPENT